MAHTPGPWEVERSSASSTGSVHYAVKTSYKPEEHPHSPRFIVFMCGGLGDFHPSRAMNDYRSDPQIEDDVRLIAAAPDLLEALKDAAKAEGALINEWVDFWDIAPQPLIDALLKAQAARNSAIAKAEGK